MIIQLISLIGIFIGLIGAYYLVKNKNRELKELEINTVPEEAFVNKAIEHIAPHLNAASLKRINPAELLKKVRNGDWTKKTLMKTKVLLLKGENKVDTWLKRASHSKKFEKK
ncbi:MAG: hypothetical protein WC309_03975 [Candidatus Paceibacterota bacterium]|jgi:hypothetical protein